MAEPFAVEVPLVNPNEPEAMVVDVAVADGKQISEGDLLCALETSKSVEDVYSPTSGYVIGLASKLGTTVTAGNVLCYIGPDPDWAPPDAGDRGGEKALPADLNITDPALAVAKELDVDLATLPRGVLVTERAVREAATGLVPAAVESAAPIDSASVLIFGAGGHGKTLIELIRVDGALHPVGVIDDSPSVSNVLGVPVIGSRHDLADIRGDGIGLAVNAIGGITNMSVRVEVSALLTSADFMMPVLIHPSAVVESSARVGPGSQVLAHSYVGSDVVLADGVIVNTGAVVSHDCVLGSHANISPGCLLAGGVSVGPRTLLGMGVTTYLGIDIGSDVRVGNGAAVIADVPDGRKIRAGSSWEGAAGS
jgi:sugar O-acyltransferase (sialic acid O-acetyltransferase NeuD family)